MIFIAVRSPFIFYRKTSKLKILESLIKECGCNDGTKKFCAANKSEKFLENLVPLLPNPNPNFSSFSDSVEVRYGGPDVGRFCVASRRIEPGELIAVETPYVWLLDKVGRCR